MKKLICIILCIALTVSGFAFSSFAADEQNGLIKTEDGWRYLKDGEVDTSFVGMAKNQYNWWYIKDGEIDYSFVGLARNQYNWWYMKNGTIDYSYVGLADNQYGTWYVENGCINYKFAGMIKSDGKWYYVSGGTIDKKYEGMAKNQYNWWYISGGTIDYKYEGLAKNQYGWWYIKNGTIDYKFEGLAENPYGWWYVKNGTIDFKFNGKAQNKYGWYKVVNGKATKAISPNDVTEPTYIDGILIANKTYALPSDYNPGVDPQAERALNEMIAAAKKEGLTIFMRSGFRSYSYQKDLYNSYVSRDGKAAADRYSARPGHSEHQTGLAFDVNSLSSGFGTTPEGRWVAKNCWKYGFIIRYPEGKESITGYQYEPWHVRYLGKETAKKVYDSGLCLEEYLGITSKYNY